MLECKFFREFLELHSNWIEITQVTVHNRKWDNLKIRAIIVGPYFVILRPIIGSWES